MHERRRDLGLCFWWELPRLFYKRLQSESLKRLESLRCYKTWTKPLWHE